ERYAALRVIVAIGKNGNPRRLDVPGERLPKVFTRLIDPGEHTGQRVMVVGGGDSAVEAAVALARAGADVTLSYRRPALSRPKEHNIAAFDEAVTHGRVAPIFESTVREITDDAVVLETPEGEKTIENDAVFSLIGTEIPIAFFKRSGIRMAGEKRAVDWVMLATLLLFSCVLYFGKKAPVTEVHSLSEFLGVPGRMASFPWSSAANAVLAWLSYIGMIAGGLFLGGYVVTHPGRFFDNAWNTAKNTFYMAMFLLFGFVYFSHNLNGVALLGHEPGFWYTAMYSLTIVMFGLRRIHVNPTGYIRRQTYALMTIQVVPLFILPVFVFPALGAHGLLGDWVMTNVFPGESYWRAYGFILAWPLFIHNLATGQPTLFWLALGLVQTFAIIPWLNYLWGKGAYCGWICSCGALAETLGDEYRTKAPHGFAAKRADNAGQLVLWFAGIMTGAVALQAWTGWHIPGTGALKDIYEIVVDIVFAGVLGLGVYFFLSGRFWCRFLCPLAALMHIYTRFSLYRIRSNKKRCISCNICTKVCHMGIDVMGYANKGVPMNDVECVRCSACVINCPMQVLTFGKIDRIDLDNVRYKERPVPLQTSWASGLSDGDLRKLLAEERQKKHEQELPAEQPTAAD
ncbi:MAG: 4Fe-4S binding protein, partial [Chitinivibrionales bacterium]|nr:4Fe-4S binding protein [Chitinivibrionales bacterium]